MEFGFYILSFISRFADCDRTFSRRYFSFVRTLRH